MDKLARVVSLDYMRAIACLCVMLIHASEPFFFLDFLNGGFDTVPEYDMAWCSVMETFGRIAAVPMFVMISAYLLLPVEMPAKQFFKKRFSRIAIPFFIWMIVYASLPALWHAFEAKEVGNNLLRILTGVPSGAEHMWFIFMLLGVYLLMPVISPWLKQVSRKGELAFLGVWAFANFLPYISLVSNDLYGHCYWNDFHMFYYFSGSVGYVVAGHYIKKYVNWSLKKTLAVSIPMILTGATFTGLMFYFYIPACDSQVAAELPVLNNTFNIALMNVGAFILLLQIKKGSGRFYKIILDISNKSYGMYLMHILILVPTVSLFRGILTTPLAILCSAVSTYIISYILCIILGSIPKIGKHIVG